MVGFNRERRLGVEGKEGALLGFPKKNLNMTYTKAVVQNVINPALFHSLLAGPDLQVLFITPRIPFSSFSISLQA